MQSIFKALLLIVCLTAAGSSECQAKVEAAVKKTDFAGARALFDQYQKLDLQNDPALVNLYSDDAVIEAGIERMSGGKVWQHLSKKSLGDEISRTFKDEHLAALNKGTTYSKPHIKETTYKGQKALSVEFHGHRTHTGIKVNWILQQTGPQQDWKIVEEHSVTYSKDFKLPGQQPLPESGNQKP